MGFTGSLPLSLLSTSLISQGFLKSDESMGCLSLRVEGKFPNDLTLWTDDAVYIDFH